MFARAVADLRALGPVGRAIELGAGTGQYTGVLASMAETVVAVDSSPEALGLLRTKVDAANVETVAADVFAWSPREPADLVMFAALWSHIPTARFEAFWSAIDRMLAPGGRVFLLDESRHDLWPEETTSQDEVVVRTLAGRPPIPDRQDPVGPGGTRPPTPGNGLARDLRPRGPALLGRRRARSAPPVTFRDGDVRASC